MLSGIGNTNFRNQVQHFSRGKNETKKANLTDFIAATSLVILNEIQIHFSACVTLKFDRWAWKNNRAPLRCHFNLCVSFHNHLWIQTGVTVQKHYTQVKIINFSAYVTSKFDGWPWHIKGFLVYGTSCFVHYFAAICELKLDLKSANAQFGSKLLIFHPLWLRSFSIIYR